MTKKKDKPVTIRHYQRRVTECVRDVADATGKLTKAQGDLLGATSKTGGAAPDATAESHLAKLNASKVKELRALAALGVTYPVLSKEYGVSTVTVGQIARRTTWEWIPAANNEKREGIDLLLKRPHLMTERERMLLARRKKP